MPAVIFNIGPGRVRIITCFARDLYKYRVSNNIVYERDIYGLLEKPHAVCIRYILRVYTRIILDV